MKIVQKRSHPLSDQEFSNIRFLSEANNFISKDCSGEVIDKKDAARKAYIEKILGFVNLQSLVPIKIVINSGNGTAVLPSML